MSSARCERCHDRLFASERALCGRCVDVLEAVWAADDAHVALCESLAGTPAVSLQPCPVCLAELIATGGQCDRCADSEFGQQSRGRESAW